MTLSNTEHHYLTQLARANGSPAYHHNWSPHVLRSLLNRKLIKQTPNGTYAITLAGLLEHRRNIPQ